MKWFSSVLALLQGPAEDLFSSVLGLSQGTCFPFVYKALAFCYVSLVTRRCDRVLDLVEYCSAWLQNILNKML